MRKPNYDKHPCIAVPNSTGQAVSGWDQAAEQINGRSPKVVSVDCYVGVHTDEIARELSSRLKPALVIRSDELMLDEPAIDQLVAPFLGGDDPIFGWLSGLQLIQFFDPNKLEAARSQVAQATGLVLIVGTGAALVSSGGLLIVAEMPRWEAQLRMRRNEIRNLGAGNATESWTLQYKRAFFVDWRVCDRHKRTLLARADCFLDTTIPGDPRMGSGDAVRRGLSHATTRPFRVVPFFDPGPWGGQWMKEICDLDRSVQNFAWCFDCVPEENSLLLDIGGVRMELPSVDLVFAEPDRLLGPRTHARFGAEFPIRFDFLDTMDGGNLSLQVHPITDYIQQHFGMHYTQDESYYLLDAGGDATVYLGFKDGVRPSEFVAALEAAQQDADRPLDAERFVNRWPAKKHDHFLIPAGTIHCSGKNSMVLEISATPYIFTFKLWDWGRLGLDGKPRPINIGHGSRNLHYDRSTEWVRRNLVNRFEPLSQGDGWREERTGLHELEFIETRRHWFSVPVVHDTQGTVNVLNLVEGEEAVVESPTGAFEPFVVHYAETFIVPAAVGAYRIRPSTPGKEIATIKAWVRGTQTTS